MECFNGRDDFSLNPLNAGRELCLGVLSYFTIPSCMLREKGLVKRTVDLWDHNRQHAWHCQAIHTGQKP